MAERIMSGGHKAAIAAGRIKANVVRDYLDALETSRPKPGRRVSPEKLNSRKADVDIQLGSSDMKPIKKLELMQDRRDLDAQLAALAEEPDMAAAESGFIAHAANYGARKGIDYATWREFGVPAELLGRAGVSRGQ